MLVRNFRISKDEVLRKFREKHGNKYDYSKMEYKGVNQKVCIICPKHGEWWQTPRDHYKGQGCWLCKCESMKKLIYGIGVNDVLRGHDTKAYGEWKGMLRRCYSEKYANNRAYQDCIVSPEWHLFSNFKRWFDDPKNGYQEGYHIDKDILVKGNKVYSPETCCLVPQRIKFLLVNRERLFRSLPKGVRIVGNKFHSCLSKDNTNIYIGCYDTPEEAFNAYKQAKESYIQEVATKYFNEGKITEKVYNALMNWKIEITD